MSKSKRKAGRKIRNARRAARRAAKMVRHGRWTSKKIREAGFPGARRIAFTGHCTLATHGAPERIGSYETARWGRLSRFTRSLWKEGAVVQHRGSTYVVAVNRYERGCPDCPGEVEVILIPA